MVNLDEEQRHGVGGQLAVAVKVLRGNCVSCNSSVTIKLFSVTLKVDIPVLTSSFH